MSFEHGFTVLFFSFKAIFSNILKIASWYDQIVLENFALL